MLYDKLSDEAKQLVEESFEKLNKGIFEEMSVPIARLRKIDGRRVLNSLHRLREKYKQG